MDWYVTRGGLFLIGGFGGWVIELFFRRFVSQKKWVNPGFLTGPLLPLYGFGLLGFFVFTEDIPWQVISPYPALNTAVEILAIGVLMTLIEYIAGLIFIKGMKIKLWDYSMRWGNIQGIICPLFSLIWLGVGAIYLYLFKKPFEQVVAWLLANEVTMMGIESFLYGILSVDLGWSLGLYTKIRKMVADRKLVVDWDKIKVSFQEHYKRLKQTPEWILPFKTRAEEFSSLMSEYLEGLRQENAQRALLRQKKMELRKQKRNERYNHNQTKKNSSEDEK